MQRGILQGYVKQTKTMVYITTSKCNSNPANKGRLLNVGLMLAHRLQRWASIKLTLLGSCDTYFSSLSSSWPVTLRVIVSNSSASITRCSGRYPYLCDKKVCKKDT